MNEAVEIAHKQGVLSAASLMVAAAAAGEAVALAKRMPRLRVGLHLALLEAPPAAPREEIPDLLDTNGNLRGDMVTLSFALLNPVVLHQLRKEIAAQFAAFRKTGLTLDHVNAHKHFHVHPLVTREVIAACRENGATALRVPYEPPSVLKGTANTVRMRAQGAMAPWCILLRARARRAGLATPDAVFGLRWSGQMSPKRLRSLLDRPSGGLVEIYLHPAVSDSFPGHAPGYRYSEELAALTYPGVIAALRASGRRAGGYADFVGAPAVPRAAID